MEAKKEKSFINLLRGLAIFLMLWGHSIQFCCAKQFDFFENPVFKTIYSFHMPLFMLISGYLFFFSQQKRDCEELILYKAKSLLYPILMGSILHYLLTNGIIALSHGWYVDVFLGPYLDSFWFLWSVIAASFAVAIAVKLTNNYLSQAILLILGTVLVALFPSWQASVYMYPYFVAGYLFGRNEEKLSKNFNITGAISVICFIVMLFFFEKKHYIYTSGLLGSGAIESIKIDIFRWAIGLFGSISVIYICKLLSPIMKKNAIVRGFEYLGRNSLAYYILQCSFLSFWLPKFTNKALSMMPWIDWNKNILLYNFVITPIIAVLYSVFISLFIMLLKKLKLHTLIFGK